MEDIDDLIGAPETQNKAESFARGFVGGVPFTNPIQGAVRTTLGQIGVPIWAGGSEPNKGESWKQQYARLTEEEANANNRAARENPEWYYPGMVGSAIGLGGRAPGFSAKALAQMKNVKGPLASQVIPRIEQGALMGAGYSTNTPAESWAEAVENAGAGMGYGAIGSGLGEVAGAGIGALGKHGYKLAKGDKFSEKGYKIFTEPRGRATKADFKAYIKDDLSKATSEYKDKMAKEFWKTLGGAGGGYSIGQVADWLGDGTTNYRHMGMTAGALMNGGSRLGSAGGAYIFSKGAGPLVKIDRILKSPTARQTLQGATAAGAATINANRYQSIDDLIE